jgi:hypothetical protein
VQKSELFKSLTPDLAKRIASADLMEPYVWRLKLSAADFEQLELAITQSISEKGGSYTHLISADSAWVIMVYLAEWYKRRYSGGESNSGFKAINPESSELKKLWELSGIDTNTFVYTSDKGDRLWQYSMYVLGGLGIRHELGRKQSARFLKQLCRLLHNENGILEAEEFKEDNRAISFRGSIVQKHSLYEFLNDIIGHKLPFSDEDLVNSASEVNRFITAIQEANNAVIRDKFDFEWVVRQTPENDSMERWLQVNLRPELLGQGLHDELHFGRLAKWGIKNAENLKLAFRIRFLSGGDCIAISSSFIHYWSAGDDLQRLIKWGDGIPRVKDIPTTHFDTIEIVAEDIISKAIYDNIQREVVCEYMQVWRVDNFKDEWSNKISSQKDTAVIYTDACSLPEINTTDIIRKPFRGKDGLFTQTRNWYYINDRVTLVDESRNEITLFNRQGHDHLSIRIYDNIIRYVEGGKVRCSFVNDYESEETALRPLIFGKEDIRALHYETRADEFPEKDTLPDCVLFMPRAASRYEEWTHDKTPQYGLLTIKAYIKGKEFKTEVFHLPPASPDAPIVRDFEYERIIYSEYLNEGISKVEFHDKILLDKRQPLFPVAELCIKASEDSFAQIEVYRPTLVKELIVDGNVYKYIKDGETLNLPYILKQRSSISDFNRNGYRQYNCKFLSSIYNLLGSRNDEHVAAWREGAQFPATRLDQYAPEWLTLVFGDKEGLAKPSGDVLYWDYTHNTDPRLEDLTESFEMAETSIMFESMRFPAENLSCMFPLTQQTPFGYESDSVSMLKCFEIAMIHETYFFIFWSLAVLLEKRDYVSLIYQPLLESKEGKLTEKDIAALLRFAEEFRFEWKEFGIILKTI